MAILDQQTNTTLVSRNITVMGNRTSIRMEPEMWAALKDIAKRESCTIHDICTLVRMRKRPLTSLTAAIRVFLMLYYKAASTEEGHARAGHGSFNNMVMRARLPEDDTQHFSKAMVKAIQAHQVMKRHEGIRRAAY